MAEGNLLNAAFMPVLRVATESYDAVARSQLESTGQPIRTVKVVLGHANYESLSS